MIPRFWYLSNKGHTKIATDRFVPNSVYSASSWVLPTYETYADDINLERSYRFQTFLNNKKKKALIFGHRSKWCYMGKNIGLRQQLKFGSTLFTTIISFLLVHITTFCQDYTVYLLLLKYQIWCESLFRTLAVSL